MSGGSWDYVYHHIQEAVDGLLHQSDPLRVALGRKLEPFVKALHDIEWVDSCDYGKGQECEAIMAALGTDAKALILNEVVQKARAIKVELDDAIHAATATSSTDSSLGKEHGCV